MDTQLSKNFADNIRFLTCGHGERAKLADKAGISAVYLNKIIQGRTANGPSLNIALKISESLKISLHTLCKDPNEFRKARVK